MSNKEFIKEEREGFEDVSSVTRKIKLDEKGTGLDSLSKKIDFKANDQDINNDSGGVDKIDNLKDIEKWIEETRKLKGDLDKTKNILNKDRISIITILGIFVSIFTFVSVEFQAFKYINEFNKIIGLTFILAGVLMVFILILDFIVRCWLDKNDKNIFTKRFNFVIWCIVVLIIIGFWCIFNLNIEKQNNIELKYQQSFINFNIVK